MIFKTTNFKGALFLGVLVLIFCTSSNNALYLYQVSTKFHIDEGIKVM